MSRCRGGPPRSISLWRGTAPSRLSVFAQPLSYTAHYYNVRHNTALVSSFITANGKAPCMSAMAKIALLSLSCKPFHDFNMLFLFPSFRFSSFLSLGKWGIKEGRRHACAPPAYLKLPFSLPTGEGRGGASLYHELFPVLDIDALGEHVTLVLCYLVTLTDFPSLQVVYGIALCFLLFHCRWFNS